MANNNFKIMKKAEGQEASQNPKTLMKANN